MFVLLIIMSLFGVYILYRNYREYDNIHHDWRPSSFYSISNRKHKEGE